MQRTFLFIANDAWFDFDAFVKVNQGEIYWFKRPKSLRQGDAAYFYLAGKTKAVKYEFRVINDKITWGEAQQKLKAPYERFLSPGVVRDWGENQDTPVVTLKLVRVLKDLAATSPQKLKTDGKVLGSLMSSRELKPYAAEYLRTIK